MSSQIDIESSKLLFGIRRSIRYHTRRWRFYDRFGAVCKFLSVLGGAATISAVLAKFGQEWTIAFAAIVTIFSSLDLIVCSAQKSRQHNDFARQFVELEKEITLKERLSDEDMRLYTAKRLEIESLEPPPLRILDMICHNELCRAMGYDESQQAEIKWYQRLFCQFIDLGDYSVKSPKCS